MKVFTKWMLTLMLLVVCIGANAEKKYLTFKCEDYCAAKWNAETNTLSWGSGGWNTAWTFMAANYEDGTAVSGDLSEWELLHLNAKNFTNASAKELTVVFKKNDGSNPPSGPTREFVVSPDENGDITIDLTNVEWGNCDITNIQDLTIYGGARDDNSVDASVVVTDAYLAKGESEAPLGEPILTLKGIVGEETTLTFGVWDTEDEFSVDFGDGQLQTAKVGIDNKGPVNEDGTTASATKFTGTVAGDGTIKVYGNNDIWYLITTNGVMPTTFDQPKLMNVVQMSITGADVESVVLPAYPKMTQFSFNNSSAKSVDVSNVPTLTSLTINNMSASKFEPQLESIDLSKNPELTFLSLQGNTNNYGKLKTIDLTNNTKLDGMGLYLQYNALTEVKIGDNTLSMVNVQNNQLEEFDLTKFPSLKNLYASDNKLKKLDFSALQSGGDVNIYNNELTEVNIPVTVKTIQAQNNKIASVNIAGVSGSNCKFENNLLTLATIPAQPAGMNSSNKTKKFTYAPQAALEVAESLSELDLSAQLTVAKGELDPTADEDAGIAAYSRWLENGTTTYSFVTASGTALVEGTDYEVTEPGKFKFLKEQTEKVHGVMLNPAFPKFTEAAPFVTTEFTVVEGGSDVPEGVATLEHTATSYCEGDAETYISNVDAETEYVNNSAFTGAWQGAAYAEFSLANLPANATITEAILTFTGIGESRRARNADVMLVNAGESLDYTALAAGNAKVNLGATLIQSVTFPKGASEVFTIDATEQLNALVAGGQKYAIFKFTNNPGSGYIAGKASADTPTLTITFAPGAPEIANASFEADGEKAVSNGPMELAGWTFEGVGTQYNNTEIRPANSESKTSQFGTSAPNDGDYSLFFRQGWNGNGNIITLTSDALNEIPSGDYLLSVAYKQHYSYDNTTSDNTFVALSLVNGETTLATGRAASAAGVQGSSADATYFNDTEWSTLEVPFSLDENLAAGAKIVIALNAGGQRRSDFFIDNVKLEKVAGVEVALKELETAIAEAQAKADTYTVGDGLFMYAASEIEPLTAAIATAQAAYTAAESKEAVATATETLNAFIAAFAPVATLPDANKTYTFQSKQNDYYMTLSDDGITIAEDPYGLKFEAAEDGKYYLTDGVHYVGLAGTDNWSMSSAADLKEALTIAAKVVDEAVYYTLAESKGFIGVDYPKKDNLGCWANKGAGDGDAILWTVAEIAVAPGELEKVAKKAEMTGELKSIAELEGAKFMLQNEAGLVLYTPDGWDVKVADLITATANKGNGGFFTVTPLDGDHAGQYQVPIYNLDGTRRTYWAGEQYLNSQPAGVSDVIFGLDGTAPKYGQDGQDLALWTITYEEGKGFAFHCVGRDIYLSNDESAARPSETVVYWKAYTGYNSGYDEAEILAAYAAATAAVKTTDDAAALANAKTAYDEDKNLDKFGDAVNAAIDAIKACEALNEAYSQLDETGAAVAAEVLAKYNASEYANIAALRAAYIPAAKAQTTAGANMTLALVNPSFELGTIEGWISTDGGNVANNYNFSYRTGEKFVERWTQAPGKLSDGTLAQVVTGLPAGKYKLTAEMQNLEQGNDNANGQGYYLVANSDSTAVAVAGETVVVETILAEGEELKIEAAMKGCTGNWICVDNFQLTYCGEVAPEVNPDEPEPAVADGWVSVISNGNLAGDEVVNFFTKENSGDPIPAVITPGAGKDNSRGIVINTPDNPSTGWDAQFFIQANENIPAGRKIHVEFDYMATQEAGFDTQSHAAPGDYIWWFCVGSETANTEWKHFSAEVEVSAGKLNDNGGIDGEYGKACDGSEGGKPFQTVAFNLSKVEKATTFHFDNIVFWVSDVDVSVKDVKGTNTGSGAIYDLQGRRVATPAKGLYIVNGKKIMVK